MRRGWLATVLGCGTLLVLIAIFAITTARKAQRIYAELAINNDDIQALEIQLAGLRADIFLSGLYVRDQLLDSQSAVADDQRERLHEVHRTMDQRLERIAAMVPGKEVAQIDQLRVEIARYWDFLSPVAEDPASASSTGWAAVRQQLLQRRDSSLALANDVGRLLRSAYQERHNRIIEAEGSFLNYIWTMMAFTLGLGAIVFVGCGYIVAVLNRRALIRAQEVESAERELRRLSSDLFQSQEQERKVLSRELHDEVGQTLTALGMELGNLESPEQKREDFELHLNEARRLTQDTLRTVRSLAMGLRPAMLDDAGLGPAVRYLAREFSRHSGIPASVEINGRIEDLSDAHRTCVYRVVQEALTNCARHAKAKNVRIVLIGHEDSVSLRVEDDGVGISEFKSSGLGLIGIGERARELKGRVHINSGADRGTVLRIDLPLAAKAL